MAAAAQTVILGGGLAGLAASFVTGAPVYEAAAHVGGVAASDTDAGFTFDRGIHILQTRDDGVLGLLADLGVTMGAHARRAFIHSHNTYTAYPFQVNTAGLPLGLRARCLWGFLRRGRHPEPKNYAEWMDRNLGRGFARQFLIPYSEKFWTVHPEEMTHEWTGNRVPQPSMAQVLRGALWSRQTDIGTNVTFRYPDRGGFGAVADGLSGRTGPVHLNHRAVRIDCGARRIHFADGGTAAYTTLVSTIPLPELVAICPEAPAAVAAAAARLRTNSIMVVNLGIGRPGVHVRHWVHFPEKDVAFFRISYPHTFGAHVVPAGCSAISAEVAYRPGERPDPAALTERVIADLIRVGAMPADAPIVTRNTCDVKWAYCIYDMHRQAALATVHDWLKTVDIVPTGRYGLWTYFWSDESINSGLATGRQLLAEGRARYSAT